MKYLDENKIYKLTSKIENALFNGESLKYNQEDIFALHEALMLLQQLVRMKIIGFDDSVKPGGLDEQVKQSQN